MIDKNVFFASSSTLICEISLDEIEEKEGKKKDTFQYSTPLKKVKELQNS